MNKIRFLQDDGSSYPEWEKTNLNKAALCLDFRRKPLNSAERNIIGKGNIPYYGANGIVDYIEKFIFDETIILLAEDCGNYDMYLTEPIAQFVTGKSWVNNHTHVLKANSSVSTDKFLFYALEHKDIRKHINGSSRAKLNKESMLKIELNLPSLPEQEKIANFFTALDENIDAHESKLELLKQQKQGYMQQVFSRKLRFHDDNGNTYGDWEETTLGEIAKWSSGGTPQSSNKKYYTNGTIPWCVIGDLNEKNVYETHQFITEDAIKNSSAKIFPTETVMFAMYGASIGKSGIMGKPMATNQAIACGIADKSKTIPKFLFTLMQHNKEKFISYGQGGAQPNISKGQIEIYPVTIPSISEQKKISDFFSTLDENIDAIANKIGLLKEQKQGYMQRMF